jgi:7-keto-8-aminopelargonate synthetase-like enzyme
VDDKLLKFVDELGIAEEAANGPCNNYHDEVVDAGIEALRKYDIGPCSARWFYGSFDIFIQLERRLATLYRSPVALSGHCRGRTCFLALCFNSSN